MISRTELFTVARIERVGQFHFLATNSRKFPRIGSFEPNLNFNSMFFTSISRKIQRNKNSPSVHCQTNIRNIHLFLLLTIMLTRTSGITSSTGKSK